MTQEEIRDHERAEARKVLDSLKGYSEEVEELALFMIDRNILLPVIREMTNIGNEDLSDLLQGMSDDNEEPMGFFADDNHIHWDAPVTDIPWEEIESEWNE